MMICDYMVAVMAIVVVRRSLVCGYVYGSALVWLYKGSQVGFTRVLVDYVLESFPCSASRGSLGFVGPPGGPLSSSSSRPHVGF